MHPYPSPPKEGVCVSTAGLPHALNKDTVYVGGGTANLSPNPNGAVRLCSRGRIGTVSSVWVAISAAGTRYLGASRVSRIYSGDQRIPAHNHDGPRGAFLQSELIVAERRNPKVSWEKSLIRRGVCFWGNLFWGVVQCHIHLQVIISHV